MTKVMSSQTSLSNLANYIEAQQSDVITLVRRQVVYSEIVISKDRFKEIQNTYDEFMYDYADDTLEDLKNEMVTDEVMKDFGDEEESWMLFHGDVQDCTDDMISWTDKEWSDFNRLKL